MTRIPAIRLANNFSKSICVSKMGRGSCRLNTGSCRLRVAGSGDSVTCNVQHAPCNPYQERRTDCRKKHKDAQKGTIDQHDHSAGPATRTFLCLFAFYAAINSGFEPENRSLILIHRTAFPPSGFVLTIATVYRHLLREPDEPRHHREHQTSIQ